MKTTVFVLIIGVIVILGLAVIFKNNFKNMGNMSDQNQKIVEKCLEEAEFTRKVTARAGADRELAVRESYYHCLISKHIDPFKFPFQGEKIDNEMTQYILGMTAVVNDHSDITFEKAKAIAEAQINRNASGFNVMVVTSSNERPDGWIFYYESKKYLETKDIKDQVPGNVPILVKKNGETEYIPGPPQNPPPMQFADITLPLNVQVEFGHTGVFMIVEKVVNDWRNPIGTSSDCMNCEPGTIIVRAKVIEGNTEKTYDFIALTPMETQSGRITFTDVQPPVQDGKEIKPEEYLFTFRIQR